MASRAVRWTDEKIKAAKLPPGKKEHRIPVEACLYLFLRTRADGTTSKHWQYRVQVGKLRPWLSLGAYPAVGLAKARQEVLILNTTHEAAKKGEADHPVIAARFARKTARSQPTVDELFEDFLADKRLGSKRKGGEPVRDRTIQVLRENYELDIKDQIGAAKVGKLKGEALQACIDSPRRRGSPGAAAHVYRTLRGLVNFAIRRGHIDGADPMRGIENPRPQRPGPVNAANDSELAALASAVNASGMWICTKLAIYFQLATGARPSEARLASWSEINIKNAIWTIPAERTKSGRQFKVHLSNASLSILNCAQNLRTPDNDHVFVGSKGKELSKGAVSKALFRLTPRVVEIGGKKQKPHELRKTFRTALSRLGIAPHIAELCLNHQEAETMRRVYDGHDYSKEMKAAWDAVGASLEKILIPIATSNLPSSPLARN